MNTEKQIASDILPASLDENQIARIIQSAVEDAQHWKKEAQAGTFPKIEEMNLDWEIDQDLVEAGVSAYVMQRLSFAYAEATSYEMNTKEKALQNLIAAGFNAAFTTSGLEVRGENWSVLYADRGQDFNEYHGKVPSQVEDLAVWDDATTRE